MNRKVLLILADGFRPDALAACGHPFADRLLSLGSYCLNTLTVWPSVTLPCHMSLFHSVSPDRHGILTNTYVPQVRPVNGLCEQLKAAGKTSAFFYDWEELRDLSRPASLSYSFFASGSTFTYQKADRMLTENALVFWRRNRRISLLSISASPTAPAMISAGWEQNIWRPADSPWKKRSFWWTVLRRIIPSSSRQITAAMSAATAPERKAI